MTQFQHTLKALLEGRKTETSRIVKSNEYTWICGERPAPWNEHNSVKLYLQVIAESKTETSMHHRTVWQVGKDYAIEPHRGVRSVGRYKVEAIWRQDVRTLTRDQFKAEGFDSIVCAEQFFDVWLWMHDRDAFKRLNFWRRNATYLRDRPAERYQAWRMKIAVQWETINWDAPAVRALQIEPHTV